MRPCFEAPYFCYLTCTNPSSDVAPKRSVTFAVIEATLTVGFQLAFALPSVSVATVIVLNIAQLLLMLHFGCQKLNLIALVW